MPDFTAARYESICRALAESGYRPVTMREYVAGARPGKHVLIRHDVDRTIYPALDMARLEHRYGIRSTYYVRYKNHILDRAAIARIAELGHEIGYHYETLDTARGDYEMALEIFRQELLDLRRDFDISTIAMHGNPLSRLNNRDLWKRYDFRSLGLTGEAYLSVDFDEIPYFSDSGRSWDERYKIHDTVAQTGPRLAVRDTGGLVALIRSGRLRSLYILAHPIIWTPDRGLWYKETARFSVLKVGKLLIRYTRGSYKATRDVPSPVLAAIPAPAGEEREGSTPCR